jgi:alkylation response protein AidB-like acyl-CoA dehydrogenase
MTDRGFTPLERDLVAAARRCAAASLAEAADADRSGVFPEAAYRSAAEAGLVGMAVPQAHGGHGVSVAAQAAIIEALAGGCAAVVGAVIGNGVQAALSLLHGAEPELRRRVLPPLVLGQTQIAFAISEPEAGSDAAALQCRATRTLDGWRIDGEKTMVNRATLSSAAIVFATVDPALRHKGVTAFLVDLEQPGVEIGPPMRKTGQKALPTGPIRFEGATVPDSRRLGDVGGGFALMMKVVTHARTMVAANAVGRMSGALEHAVNHVRHRRQFGAPLADLDMVKAEIADMAVALSAARCLTARAALAMDESLGDETVAAATAKLFATDACIDVCRRAMLLCGGMGYSDAHPVERMMRDALAGQVVDGANPIQKQIIAKELLRGARGRDG